jgi:uncharacterized RDD family membrane protein YckC
MKNYPTQNATPLFIEERDILGQTKPSGISVLKRYKHRVKNAPDLKVIYAGLGTRVIATFIDLIIVMGALLILEAFFFKFNYTDNEFNSYRFFIVIFIWIFYNWSFESSVYQATFGEMILKLKVVDLYGKRISVLRSFFRCITTFISILPVGLGIWYMTTDPKKRAWHDLIAGTYVIKS